MQHPLHSLLQHPEFREGANWRRVEFCANEFVFREGDPADTLFLIENGSVRIIADLELEEGRHIHPGVCDLEAGEVFGELALFDRQERSASVMAVSDCALVAFNGERLLAFLDRHPEQGYAVLRDLITALVGRLRNTNRKLFSILAWGLKARGLDQHL
jgi:CRP-like cAMP-binding protein